MEGLDARRTVAVSKASASWRASIPCPRKWQARAVCFDQEEIVTALQVSRLSPSPPATAMGILNPETLYASEHIYGGW